MRTGEFEEIVGYHLEQAHEHLSALGPPDERTTRVAERAGAHLASAGHRALVRGDLTSARNLLERSHRLFPDPPPRVLVDLGLAQSDGGEFAVAQDTFDEAVAAARRNGDREMEWTAIVEGEDLRLNQATTGGATERALKMARRAMEVFDEVGDDAGLARAWLVVGNAHNHVGEQVGMYEAAQRAIEHARRAGDERHEVWARTLMSSAMTWGPLPVNEGLEVAEDLLARSSGSPLLAASALRVTGNLKALQGAFDEARSLAARIIAIYEEFGRPVAVATNLAFLNAQIEWIAQNWAEAERLLRRSSEMLEEMGEHGWLSTIVAQWANALVELGRDDEAYRCTERSEELSAPDDQASQVMWRSARAKVLAKRGEGDAAMALAREGVRIADSTEAPVWQADAYVALADVARSNGDRAEEERALREALRRYGAKGATGPLEPVRRRLGSVPST